MLISTLAVLLKTRAPEAPNFMLQRLIRESAREFFKDSRSWRIDFGGAITAGSDAYDLTLPTGALGHDILYAKLTVSNTNLEYLRDAAKAYITPDDVKTGLDTKHITLIDNNTFCLSPPPQSDDVIDMKIVLTLQRDATDIDDQIIEEYEDVIINGALARLYEQPNKTWSNIRLAQYHSGKFTMGTGKAKLRAEETRTPGARVASFSW